MSAKKWWNIVKSRTTALKLVLQYHVCMKMTNMSSTLRTKQNCLMVSLIVSRPIYPQRARYYLYSPSFTAHISISSIVTSGQEVADLISQVHGYSQGLWSGWN